MAQNSAEDGVYQGGCHELGADKRGGAWWRGAVLNSPALAPQLKGPKTFSVEETGASMRASGSQPVFNKCLRGQEAEGRESQL